MHPFRKILIGLGLAGVLSLSVIWGTRAPAVQHTVRAVAAEIQKPGHVSLAMEVQIQKPGH
jgi:hypothetical protein